MRQIWHYQDSLSIIRKNNIFSVFRDSKSNLLRSFVTLSLNKIFLAKRQRKFTGCSRATLVTHSVPLVIYFSSFSIYRVLHIDINYRPVVRILIENNCYVQFCLIKCIVFTSTSNEPSVFVLTVHCKSNDNRCQINNKSFSI